MFDANDLPFCDQRVLAINRLPARAHFLTATTAQKALAGAFDRAESLNGIWSFQYLENTLLDEQTLAGEPARAHPDTIAVPRSWQFAGYGAPLYTDEDFPFPIDPPYVPANTPVGVYRRVFTAPDCQDERLILRFEGVESCASVYVNGRFAGYTQGSRLPAEFDVTALCRPGDNELCVIVRQYCDGSYLEDQDMWWLGGIIRDVLLLRRPRTGEIADIALDADYDADTRTGFLRLRVRADGARFTLLDDGGDTVLSGDAQDDARYTLHGVTPWNAEQPRLYTLLVETASEAARLRVGFRRVEIASGELRVNGARVMLRGVNRHEFSPENGRAVTPESTRSDLMLMKQAHINAVRTAHYPDAPYFYSLCDELGLYVIDECDLETHGFEREGAPARLADDPAWRAAYLDRAERTLARDRNHACVVMWSLANESYRGENLWAMCDFFHAADATRPVHYEGDHEGAHADVISAMYTSVEKLIARDAADPGKPLMLCEFAHAMGNGPGGLLEYDRAIDESRHIQGYFIWEWRDHGIRRARADGGADYLFGGDFHEDYHSGNFCMDGMLSSDGTPTPAFCAYAKMNEPARAELTETSLRVRNRFDFTALCGAAARLTLRRDGETIREDVLALPHIAPHAEASLAVPDYAGDMRANALYTLEATVEQDGARLGAVSRVLRAYRPAPRAVTGDAPRVLALADRLLVSGDAFSLEISLGDGRIRNYAMNGVMLMEAGPAIDLFRATIDNDVPLRDMWKNARLDSLRAGVRRADWRADGGVLTVDLSCSLGANARLWRVPYTLRYDIYPNGAIRARLSGRFEGLDSAELPELPRIGTTAVLPGGMRRALYCGFGAGETYCDSLYHARLDVFESDVSALAFPYECPQESGNRAGCAFSALTDERGLGMACATAAPHDFGASEYSARQLESARRRSELAPSGHVFWRVDWRNAGLGSASCGPGRLPAYIVRPEPFDMTLALAPVTGGGALAAAREAQDALC